MVENVKVEARREDSGPDVIVVSSGWNDGKASKRYSAGGEDA